MINYLFNEHFNTERSRLNFILGLIQVSKADDEDEENGQRLMTYLFDIMRLSYDATRYVKENYNHPLNVPLQFDNNKQAQCFILAALFLAYLDGTLQEKEEMMIHELAHQLNVPKQTTLDLQQVVLKQLNLMKEVKTIISK